MSSLKLVRIFLQMCDFAFISPNATPQMRGQVETHLEQVEQARNSITSAEQRLQECQENLQRCKEKCAEQALTVRELQGQVSHRVESWKMC